MSKFNKRRIDCRRECRRIIFTSIVCLCIFILMIIIIPFRIWIVLIGLILILIGCKLFCI
ncbi:hypothetical protein [Caminicella sporogenes]|uniref:hypothetical protein n=1 Tax=Caminicella sporogenes TaxID=166485 RepID=UPI00254062FB|nr:hypothetical protein [Caminicella sporogenes]WIF94593.1 hypothetical protein QNI18_10035 [Caminicella sporogenes]